MSIEQKAHAVARDHPTAATTGRRWWPWAQGLTLHVVLPGAFVLLVLFAMPIRETLEFDTDEGINLIKALLFERGFPLYDRTWSDQPPLFTVMLCGWFKLSGPSVAAARVLVLIMAALLVWSFAWVVKLSAGFVPAVAATIMLGFSWLFVRLSASVMIGLPSLSLAMLSVLALMLYLQQRRPAWLLVSGSLLALSLHTKLFACILIPVFAVTLVVDALRSQARGRWQGLTVWALSTATVFLLVGWSYGALTYQQLVEPHLGEKVRSSLNSESLPLWRMIGKDAAYASLAALGGFGILLGRSRRASFAFGWGAAAFLVLWLHKPVWSHHILLLSIPLAWLAGCGVGWIGEVFARGAWRRSPKTGRDWLRLGIGTAAVLAALHVAWTMPFRLERIVRNNYAEASSQEMLDAIRAYRDTTRWIFTDRPIYAFVAGLPVPPQSAVITMKRVKSGNLTSQDVLRVFSDYRPEQVVLTRFRYGLGDVTLYDQRCMDYLEGNYTAAFDDGWQVQYVRNDLAPKPSANQDPRPMLRKLLKGSLFQ